MSSTSRHPKERRRRRAAERPPYDPSVPPWARTTGWHLDGVTHVARRARVAAAAIAVAITVGAAALGVLLAYLVG